MYMGRGRTSPLYIYYDIHLSTKRSSTVCFSGKLTAHAPLSQNALRFRLSCQAGSSSTTLKFYLQFLDAIQSLNSENNPPCRFQYGQFYNNID